MKNYRLSKRSEILAIKIKNKIDKLKSSVPRPVSGIPLNALPGWSDVPLYEKLPMLDCPNNQIIFTKNIIGRGLPEINSEYDTNCQNEFNEYDSLNDPHLRNFYSSKRNLELLKNYGLITNENYVICNLQEFNNYRRLLNRLHLFSIHKELKKEETERHDKKNIEHAESLGKKEYVKRMLKADYCDPKKVLELKKEIFNKKLEKNKLNLINIEEKNKKIKKIKDLELMVLKEKSQLHQVAIQQRQTIANEISRKNVIAIKKYIKKMNYLSIQQIKALKEGKLTNRLEKKKILWDKRIQNTIKTHKKNAALLAEYDATKCRNIERHIQNSKNNWQRIEKRLDRARNIKYAHTSKMVIEKRISKQLNTEIKKQNMAKIFSISKLTCKDIQDAVYTAIDLQENLYCPYKNKNIYEAAKYIIEQVLANIDYDLNYNKNYFNVVSQAVDDIFNATKRIILEKAKLVLKDLKSLTKFSKETKNTARTSCARSVSFGEFSSVIGISALQEEYDMFCSPVIIKSVKGRMPTPAGSLTSITVALEEATRAPLIGDTFLCQKDKNEKIFLGHFLIKFKRHLIVGISQRVFEVLKKYVEKRVFEINKQLLEVDKRYLRNEVAKSILKYNINKYDFQANLRFCISALASDVIWELQKDQNNNSYTNFTVP